MGSLGNNEILDCKFFDYVTQLLFKKIIKVRSGRLAKWAEQNYQHLFGLVLLIYCKTPREIMSQIMIPVCCHVPLEGRWRDVS